MYTINNFKGFIKNISPINSIKRKFYVNRFLNTKLEESNIINSFSEIDIYIVAFNWPELIEYQILSLKKNLIDKYRLIIVDNSNNTIKSSEIKGICNKYKISYIKLPDNKLFSSYSHGLSLNYIVKNIIKKQKTQYIGFLDHDCFLIKKFSIVNILKVQKIYGNIMGPNYVKIFSHIFNFSGNRWNLRPGCAFYDKDLFNSGFDFLPNKRFIPISFLDTGGGNWKYIYKNIDITKLKLINSIPIDGGSYNLGNIFLHLGGAGYRNEDMMNKMIKKLHQNHF